MKIEMSNGDVVDRYTILSIKKEKITDPEKRNNIIHEHDILQQAVQVLSFPEELLIQLKVVNEALWDIEDSIRIKEKNKQFDEQFIHLARSVYFENDKRAAVKRQINILTKSAIVEEKEYVQY